MFFFPLSCQVKYIDLLLLFAHGQPMSMVLPGVVGFKLSGKLRNGVTATDLVLTVTQMLRKHGVVGKFVEFHGKCNLEMNSLNQICLNVLSFFQKYNFMKELTCFFFSSV